MPSTPQIGGVLIRRAWQRPNQPPPAPWRPAAETEVVPGLSLRCDPNRPTSSATKCAERFAKWGPLPIAYLNPHRLSTCRSSATEDRVVGTWISRRRSSVANVTSAGCTGRRQQRVLYVDGGQPAGRPRGRSAAGQRGHGRQRRRSAGVSAQHPARFVLVGSMNPERACARSCSTASPMRGRGGHYRASQRVEVAAPPRLLRAGSGRVRGGL